jgi:GNAT superfamily N-acetyltransferase
LRASGRRQPSAYLGSLPAKHSGCEIPPRGSASMLQITHAATAEQFKQVWQLRSEMSRWDADQAQHLGLDPAEVLAFFYPTDDHVSLRANAPPEVEWLLATFAGKAAGCGAFRRIDANTCELQYVYVRDDYRGKRIGRLMVEQLVAKAKAVGYKVMRLETTTFMKEARALYASIGFRPRGPYYEVPKVFEPFTVFMELMLVPPDVR